jgi:hypothetical protein
VTKEYFSEFDRWFAEEHDGSPVEWLICDGYLKGDPDDEPNNLSLCATKPDGHKLLDFEEKHVVRHCFMASSYIEACNKRNEILGWGPYIPFPDWDVERGRWRSQDE